MNKKALIISPTPTAPANAGNRVHISSICELLRADGWDLYFFYLQYESYDHQVMNADWNGRFYVLERKELYTRNPSIRYYLRAAGRKMSKLKRWIQKATGLITPEQYAFNSEVDSFFPEAAVSFIRELQKKHDFRMVICEYVFMSKALTYFNDEVFKVLDTHDCFTDRFNLYLSNNLNPVWISLYKDQERKAIRRAQLVIAVQETEKRYFEDMGALNVVHYGYAPTFSPLPVRPFQKKLLYLASDSIINKKTLEWFIETCLPLIIKSHPDVLLLVGGAICKSLSVTSSNIVLMGEYCRTKDFYELGDIAINPEQAGTGYKIKTLEALSYGLPVVSTRAGALGAYNPYMDHILVADDPFTFSTLINRLFEDESFRLEVSCNAQHWIKQYKSKLTEQLLKSLPEIEN